MKWTTEEQVGGPHTHRQHLVNAEQRTATTSDEAITEMVHLRDAWVIKRIPYTSTVNILGNQNKWNAA